VSNPRAFRPDRRIARDSLESSGNEEADMPEPEESSAAVRLGEELRLLRIAAGYPSIQALAARIDGYGDSLIAKVEQGKRTASRQLFPAWLDACAFHIDTRAGPPRFRGNVARLHGGCPR
jgi:hypothetical protein